MLKEMEFVQVQTVCEYTGYTYLSEDIQSGLVTHILVSLLAEMVAVRILWCTAVSQKNCRAFLFFTTSLAQRWRQPVWSRRRI